MEVEGSYSLRAVPVGQGLQGHSQGPSGLLLGRLVLLGQALPFCELAQVLASLQASVSPTAVSSWTH